MTHMQKPPGRGEAEGLGGVHVSRLNNNNSTREAAQNQLLQRLDVLCPGRDPAADAARVKLLTARDMATARISRFDDWPADHHRVHQLVSTWAGRAAMSQWPAQDIENCVDACRHLLQGTLMLKRLGEVYSDVE